MLLSAAKLTVMELVSSVRNLETTGTSFKKNNKTSGDSLLAKEHANVAYRTLIQMGRLFHF